MSDVDLCKWLREFVLFVGFPGDHVTSTKELAEHGRLFRNRVSAQQTRERKRAYLIELEVRVTDLEKRNSDLEERLSTLSNENQILRHVIALMGKRIQADE